MRNGKFKIIVSTLVASIIILIGCVAIIFLGKNTLDEKNAEIESLDAQIESYKRMVYVAQDDLVAGQKLIVGENVIRQEIISALEGSYYLTDITEGSIAITDIYASQPIMVNMVSEVDVDTDTREYEIAIANLMTDQCEGDYVDVRIMFPTGEDYVILSKKPMSNLHLEACSFNTFLNEDEILRIASAAIDAYTITGSYIYTTRYVAPAMQEASIPNYVVRAESIDLINSDKNIITFIKDTLNLQARNNLEQRLYGMNKDFVSAIADGHNSKISASSSILDTGYYSSSSSSSYSSDESDDYSDDETEEE